MIRATLALTAALLAAASLGGCGKVGSPENPPGTHFPIAYPAGAAHPVTANTPQAPTTGNAAFTSTGAWIDPDTRRPDIDYYADRQQGGGGGGAGGGAIGQPYGANQTNQPQNQ